MRNQFGEIINPNAEPALAPVSLLERVRELQLKAALKQAAIDLCPGHLWGNIHFSKINYHSGGSAACVLCGERRALVDIEKDPNAKWE